jgi:hypothetical protein
MITSLVVLTEAIFTGHEDGMVRWWEIKEKSSTYRNSPDNLQSEIAKLQELGITQQFNPIPKRSSAERIQVLSEAEKQDLIKDLIPSRKEKKRFSLNFSKKKDKKSKDKDTNTNGKEESNTKSKGSPTSSKRTVPQQQQQQQQKETFSTEEFVGWYVGNVSRPKAEELLRSVDFDAFLIRTSSVPGMHPSAVPFE